MNFITAHFIKYIAQNLFLAIFGFTSFLASAGEIPVYRYEIQLSGKPEVIAVSGDRVGIPVASDSLRQEIRISGHSEAMFFDAVKTGISTASATIPIKESFSKKGVTSQIIKVNIFAAKFGDQLKTYIWYQDTRYINVPRKEEFDNSIGLPPPEIQHEVIKVNVPDMKVGEQVELKSNGRVLALVKLIGVI